jgi:hypothetical protein
MYNNAAIAGSANQQAERQPGKSEKKISPVNSNQNPEFF